MTSDSRHPKRVLTAACAIAAGILVGLACGPEGGTARDSGDAPHAIHSEDLQTAMRDLNQRTKEDIAAELYTGTHNPGNLMEVANSAESIAKTARSIPNLVVATEMPAADRAEVARLSAQLRDAALVLEARARENNLAAVREAMDRVNTTCNECHTKFRFSGL